MARKSHLTTAEFAVLNDACIPIAAAFGHSPYLVGSATDGPGYRDVDIRLILPDDEFDHWFGGRVLLWSLICLAISRHLVLATGLPIDFQIQRRTEANDKYIGSRHPMGRHNRPYAGGGDATGLTHPQTTRGNG